MEILNKINAFISKYAKSVAAAVGGAMLLLGHVSEYLNKIVEAISSAP